MHSVLNGGSETDSLVFVHYEKTGGIMKKLEEMNLVDDFLVNSLISHKEYGEKASKYILECIFNMVTEVKHDGKVGFAYMKSFEREQRIKEQSRQEGKAEGKAEALLQILSCRGTVSESLREWIRSEHNSEILDLWVRDAI